MRIDGSKIGSVGLQLLMAVLVIVSLLLLRQNLGLRRELTVPGPDSLAPGDIVESFTAMSFDGEVSVTYGPQEKAKVFLYLSPDCGFCGRQMPYWHQLVNQIDMRKFEVFTIARDSESLEGLREYVSGERIDAVPLILAPERVWRSYKLWGTPTTLVVSHDGSVIRLWRGLWGLETREEARNVLGISFRGV